jgi:excinuclease ABC subunit C
LLVLDGGKPQVSEINKIIKKHNIHLNIIGLVKNDDHSTRAIINFKYKEIKISDSFLMNFLAGMQIEVDRFAKQHHSRRRRISSMEGKLLNINGVGQKTEDKLIQYFVTYSAIYNASIEELEKVVSTKIAVQIKNQLY